MDSRLLLFICLLCTFSVYKSESYPQPDAIKGNNSKHPSTEQVTLSCECDGESHVEILNISMSLVTDYYMRKAPCHLNNFKSHPEICELFEKCEVCIAETEQCKFKDPEDEFCGKLNNIYFLNNTISHRNIRSPTDVDYVLSGHRRYSNGCIHPRKLGNSILKFTYYHKGLKITQKCSYGHTLSNGISRVYKCRYDEDVWYPEEFGFEPCDPFIHCEMTLIHHGAARCTTATIDNPPQCHVSCPHYEDKDPDERTSICDVDGLWKPELPHCAARVDGEKLVPAPEIKLHFLEEEIAKSLEEVKMKVVEEE